MAKKKVKKLPIKLNEVKTKEIDFRTTKVVSFTQYSMYQQCPTKWANQYVRKLIKTPQSIHFTFGTAMHEVIQEYIKTMYEQSGAAADRLDLEEMLQTKMVDLYQKGFEDNKNTHYSSPEELREFFEDGVTILNWLRKNRGKYFSVKNTYLVGIEMPLQKYVKSGLMFTGFIDLVLYEENINKIKIYDIKTSTKGWNSYAKKDEDKLAQIILYKKLFSELYGFPIDNINVEFFIVKRKAEPNEFQEFPRHVQTFSPASGKIKINQVSTKFDEFLKECFDEEGKPIEKDYIKNVSKLCEYCPFYKNEHCGIGLKK